MRVVRYWSVQNAGFLERLYSVFESVMVALHPLWKCMGYERAEKPVVAIEKVVKGFLFDCQMCGQCMLSSNGMSCPMNCPKTLRNGPCGGVRPNGHCEVDPEMRCVFVEAVKGSRKMKTGNLIETVQLPVNYQNQGSSSWLREARDKAESTDALKVAEKNSAPEKRAETKRDSVKGEVV